MQSNELSRILKDAAPLPSDEIKRIFQLLSESRKESEITKRELKKYTSAKDVMIQEITGKYRFYEFLFSRIFEERGAAIKKDFDLIDQGMKENDRDLINAGVSGLSQVVASNPFTDMEKLKNLLDSFGR